MNVDRWDFQRRLEVTKLGWILMAVAYVLGIIMGRITTYFRLDEARRLYEDGVKALYDSDKLLEQVKELLDEKGKQ